MGYSYVGGSLCCDFCDMPGGVRKYRCPFGYCQALAACPPCRKTHARVFTKEAHRELGCEKYHEEFVARQALEKLLLAKGQAVRCSALSIKHNGKDVVHVLFKKADGACVGFYMDHTTYDAIPILTPATPKDYREFGILRKAPADYHA